MCEFTLSIQTRMMIVTLSLGQNNDYQLRSDDFLADLFAILRGFRYRVSTNQLFKDIDAQQVYHKSPADSVFLISVPGNLYI